MSSVLSTLYVLYTLNKSFTFYKWGEGSGLGRLPASSLLCRMASSLVMKTSSSRKLQWPFKKQGGRKEEEKKKRKSCNKLSEVWTKCGIEIIFQWAFSLIFMHLQFDEVFINFSTFSRSINVSQIFCQNTGGWKIKCFLRKDINQPIPFRAVGTEETLSPILVAQLTLFQSGGGGADDAHTITTHPPPLRFSELPTALNCAEPTTTTLLMKTR